MPAATARTFGTSTPPTGFVTMTGHSDMNGAANVATISTGAATCSMVFNTITSTADDRVIFTLGGSVLNDFAVIFRADATTDHDEAGMVLFTIGGVTAPAFSSPDTITLKKYTGGTPTSITPTNTANGVPNDFPSIVGDTVSLRHHRLASGDKIEVMWADDQVIVRLNDIVVFLEEFTGGRDATGYWGIVSYAGSSTDQSYGTLKSGSLVARYVNSSTGNDSNSGLVSAPWLTLGKGIKAQAIGEVVFVSGTFTEAVLVYNLSPAPRTATSFEEPIFLAAKAGQTVVNSGNALYHTVGTAYKYSITYNITWKYNSAGGSDHVIRMDQGSVPHMMIGGGVVDGNGTGISLGANSGDFTGGHIIRDMNLRANGRLNGSKHHVYSSVQNVWVQYCRVNGAANTYGATLGYGLHMYYSSEAISTATSGTRCEYNVISGITGSTRAGILLARGTDMIARSNRVYGNTVGIEVSYQCVDPEVINNDVYSNTDRGVRFGGVASITGAKALNNTLVNNAYGLYNDSNSTTATAKNNIAWNNSTANIFDEASGLTATTTFSTDPDFVDDLNNIHQLNDTSTAKNGAADLSAEMDAVDYRGVVRPSNTTWGYGAYELENPPLENPIVVADSSVEVTVDVSFNLNVQVTDPDGDARKIRINRTGSLVLTAPTPSGTAVVKGFG